MLLLNLYRLRSALSLEMTTCSGQILSERTKLNWEVCHFEIQPNRKGSGAIHHFWPNYCYSSVRELVLTLFRQVCFRLSSKIMLPCCSHIAITLVRLNQLSRVRMRQKDENVIYNDTLECFLRMHWFWGHNRRFLRTLKSAQPRNSSSLVDFKIT
jgi:hypothetical protein